MGTLKEKFAKVRKDQWFLALLGGILLLVIAIPVKDGGTGVEKPESGSAEEEMGESVSITDMEIRLQDILCRLEGAGKVRVMITQKSSEEKIVEKDVPVSDRNVQEQDESGTRSTVEQDKEEATVYVRDENGNQTPYVTRELAPQIEGVLVLAEGGDNGVVVKNITEAVMALFDLEVHKIKVMKMN